MSWYISLWVSPVWDSLDFLDLAGYFLFHGREVFNYKSPQIFSHTLSFSLLLDPYNLNVGMFNIVPEVSELSLILFILVSFFCPSAVISVIPIFQFTYLFFCFSYSALDSF